MKGIVFTKFFEMIEEENDYEMVDSILEEVQPESGGSYTAVGTYSHTEMVNLVVAYAQKAGIPVDTALHKFGRYLFDVFYNNYQAFFPPDQTAFEFLRSIDGYIHIEVAKLYPDAQLPRFETEEPEPGILVMTYISERKMADLAYGLIEKTLEHFKETKSISKEILAADGSHVKFTIK